MEKDQGPFLPSLTHSPIAQTGPDVSLWNQAPQAPSWGSHSSWGPDPMSQIRPGGRANSGLSQPRVLCLYDTGDNSAY